MSEKLIDVHSQHQTQLLNNNQFQVKLVDANAGNESLFIAYSKTYNQFKEINKTLGELIEKEAKLKADQDYFQFQYDELEAIKLDNIHEDELKEELDVLNNSEEIKSHLTQSLSILEDEMGVVSQLKSSESLLLKIGSTGKKIGELKDRITSVLIELQDITSDMEDTNEAIVFDQERIDELSDKLITINSLHQKHRTKNIQDLVEIRNRLEENLLLVSGFDEEKLKLETQKNALLKKLTTQAKAITESRIAVAPKIEIEINLLVLLLKELLLYI